MPRLLQPFASFWIPSRYFVMDMSAGKKFVNIKQGNARLGELYGALEDLVQSGAALSDEQRVSLSKDEGMVLVSQILLMSGCEAIIGSYSSNVAILVHDLMCVPRHLRHPPRLRHPSHLRQTFLRRLRHTFATPSPPTPRTGTRAASRAGRSCTPSTSTAASTADAAPPSA